MSLVEGPFPQVTFCGASVTTFSSSLGWNQESSSVTVNLVEDPDRGQRFSRPQVGTPVKFKFEGFTFEGLVQRWLEKNAVDGMPTYEITIQDPREILAGAQVILSSYLGNVGGFANLINAFGFWEAKLGFGGSLVNESGMVWNAPFEILGVTASSSGASIHITNAGTVGILPAIQFLTRNGNQFGGPLKYMGHSYSVDLSGLPNPPAYYRMGGVSASILDMVSEICQDGGNDFICNLKGNVITFKTVSRVRQPDPGQIANFINSRTDVITKSIGMELRNDISNAIILGGDVTELVQEYNTSSDNTIWPYWGKDIDGSVIMGVGQPEVHHEFHLNSSAIADIVGSTTYPSDIVEMRCALIDFDSWAYYVLKWWPKKAKVINLISAIDHTSDLFGLFTNTIFIRDMINDGQQAINLFGPMNDNDYWTKRAQRVYEFVKSVADNFFGRKFLVKIPFLIYYKMEPETTHIVKSAEPTDAGYQIEGIMPLGLNFFNEGLFMGQDGRFQCFVKYTNALKSDVQQLSPDSCVIQGSDIYMKATVDSDIGVVYPGGSAYPYCVITVDGPVFEQADDPLGSLKDIAALLDYQDLETLRFYAAGLRHDSFPLKIHPSPYRPDAVAIPMKSNRDSYGPWFSSGGVDGKVSFERDESLVPWNYGDYNTMNLAAQAKLANAATRMQFTETGTIELAGSPDHSLGDELVAGGPQLTGIDVSVGSGGVTTSYRMQTFTPRFGTFTKNNADRLRRLGTGAMEMRRAVRNLYQQSQSVNSIVASAQMGFMANTSRAVRQQSPHQCVVSHMSWDKKYLWRTQVSTMTAPEAVANCRGDTKDAWPATALMTLEGLLRPFSTNWNRPLSDPRSAMPHYETGDERLLGLSSLGFDPFGEFNDIDYTAWGDKYPGRLHTLKANGGDPANSRLVGLRGPLVVVGWGYSYTGKPIPNPKDDGVGTVAEQDWSDNFIDRHRSHMEQWKAGPVGLHWDNWRKVWTIPTVLFGTLDTDYTNVAGKGTLMSIVFLPDICTDKVRVYNWLGGDSNLKQGMLVCAAYHQQSDIWVIISASCTSS
jgi:hypothetical protein